MDQRYIILITKEHNYFCLEYGLAKHMVNLLEQMQATNEAETNVKFVLATEIEYAILDRLVGWMRKEPSQRLEGGGTKTSPEEILKQFCDEHINLESETILAMAVGATYLGLPVLVHMLKYLIQQKLSLHTSKKQKPKGGKCKCLKPASATLNFKQMQSIPVLEQNVVNAEDTLRSSLSQTRLLEQAIVNTQTKGKDGRKIVNYNFLIAEKKSNIAFLQMLSNLKPSVPKSCDDTNRSVSNSCKFKNNTNFTKMSNKNYKNETETNTQGAKECVRNKSHRKDELQAHDCGTTHHNLKQSCKQNETSFVETNDLTYKLRCPCCLRDIQLNKPSPVAEVNASVHEKQKQNSKPKNKKLDINRQCHNESIKDPKTCSCFKDNDAHNKRQKDIPSVFNNRDQKLNLNVEGKNLKKNIQKDFHSTAKPKSICLNKDTDTVTPHLRNEITASNNENQKQGSKPKSTNGDANEVYDNDMCNDLEGAWCRQNSDKSICSQFPKDEFNTPNYEHEAQNSQSKKKHPETNYYFFNDLMLCRNCDELLSVRDYFYYKRRLREIRTLNEIRKYYKYNCWSINRLNNIETQTPAFLDPALSKGVQVNASCERLKKSAVSVVLKDQELNTECKTEQKHEESKVEDLHAHKLAPNTTCGFCRKIAQVCNIAEMKKEIREMEKLTNWDTLLDLEFLDSSLSSSIRRNEREVSSSALSFYEKLYLSEKPKLHMSSSGRLVNSSNEALRMNEYLNYLESSILGSKLVKEAKTIKPDDNASNNFVSFGVQTDPIHSISLADAEVQTISLKSLTSSSVQTENLYGVVSSETQTNFIQVQASSDALSQTDYMWNAKNTGSQTEILWFVPNPELTSPLSPLPDNDINLQASPHSDTIPPVSSPTHMLDTNTVDGDLKLIFRQKSRGLKMEESSSVVSENEFSSTCPNGFSETTDSTLTYEGTPTEIDEDTIEIAKTTAENDDIMNDILLEIDLMKFGLDYDD